MQRLYDDCLFQVDIILENDYGQTPVDIQVIVENVNDRPQLVKDTDYNFTVTEDIIVGYIIGTVGVADPDQQVQIGPPEVLKVEIVCKSDILYYHIEHYDKLVYAVYRDFFHCEN